MSSIEHLPTLLRELLLAVHVSSAGVTVPIGLHTNLGVTVLWPSFTHNGSLAVWRIHPVQHLSELVYQAQLVWWYLTGVVVLLVQVGWMSWAEHGKG